MPDPNQMPGIGEPDDRVWRAPPGDGRADFRSATPMGFSRATFFANAIPARAVGEVAAGQRFLNKTTAPSEKGAV